MRGCEYVCVQRVRRGWGRGREECTASGGGSCFPLRFKLAKWRLRTEGLVQGFKERLEVLPALEALDPLIAVQQRVIKELMVFGASESFVNPLCLCYQTFI